MEPVSEEDKSRITVDVLKTSIAQHDSITEDQVDVVNFDISGGSKKGDGFVCVVLAIRVQAFVKNERKEYRMIAKMFSQNDAQKQVMRKCKIMETEIEAYQLIQKLNDSRFQKGMEPLSMAHCYYTSNKEEIIIMEDLKEKGFILEPKSVEGLGIDHIKLALKRLAQLHASTYHYMESCPGGTNGFEKDNFLFRPRGFFRSDLDAGVNKMIMAMESNMIKSTIKIIDVQCSKQLADKLRAFSESREEVLARIQKDLGKLPVVVHGDAWNNNMMFRKKDGNIQEVALLDLQCMRMARPSIDVVYFLWSSTSPKSRLEHLDSLLKFYHDHFMQDLGIFGYSNSIYTFEDFQKDIQDSLPLGLVYGFMHAQVLVLNESNAGTLDFAQLNDESNMQDMGKKMEENAIALAKSNPDYVKRLVSLAQEAESMNLI